MSHVWMLRDGTKSADLAVRTNGDYHIIWDARADLGKVRCTNMVVWVNIIKHKKVQLWEGGPYWAETNIGAENPWDPGYYSWWGDTVGYTYEKGVWVASNGSSRGSPFKEVIIPTCNKDNATLQREGWITAGGVLVPNHDAARAKWGGEEWRMPTQQELEELCEKCTWTWKRMNGVNGYVVRGRGDYADANIFLPAAGYGDGTSLYVAGSYGGYWSSVPTSDNSYAWYLGFYSGCHFTRSNYGRYYGRSVRPVKGFTK